jgi:hypothetical protein
MSTLLKSTAIAGAFALAAGSASAATITGDFGAGQAGAPAATPASVIGLEIGDNISLGANLDVDGDIGDLLDPTDDISASSIVTFVFEALETLRVLDLVTATGNGFNSGADLANMELGLNGNLVSYSPISLNGATASGQETFPGFVLAAGDTFTFTFKFVDGVTTSGFVQNDLTFVTAPVPLPASVWMMLAALGGTAAIARRKTKKVEAA